MRVRVFAAMSFALVALPAWADASHSAGVALSPETRASERRVLLATPTPAGPLLGAAEGADGGGPGSILTGALYGGLAGAVIGLGVGLIENDNYGRDIAIGAGAGILVGAALGATHAFGDSRSLAATDGLSSPERYPMRARTLRVAGSF